MKIKKAFLLFISLFMFTLCAKAQTCDYEYLYSLDFKYDKHYIPLYIVDTGDVKSITLTYTDKKATFNYLGELKIQNWGKDESGFNKVGTSSCPKYLFNTDLSSRKWYGSNVMDDNVKENIFNNDSLISKVYGLKDQIDDSEKPQVCSYDSADLAIFWKERSVDFHTSGTSASVYSGFKDQIFSKDSFDCAQVWLCSATGYDPQRGQVITTTVYWDFVQYKNSNSQYSDKDCKTIYLKDDPNHEKTSCSLFNISNIKELKEKYEECGNDDVCKGNLKIENNDTYTQIKGVCHSALSTLDYDDPCTTACLDLYKGVLSGEDSNSGCNLPEKLLIWILNIVKWVKYIVPVIVILFGMLDFIRAVLADKDDGMKKAQGRFVRRLIAAALIFIVPLILTFILEKMGFTAEMCDIKF